MSVRVHELAKKLGLGNKELVSLLSERHYPVKSVSSTVDSITAEALVEEFKTKAEEEAKRAAENPVPPAAPALEAEPPRPAAATATEVSQAVSAPPPEPRRSVPTQVVAPDVVEAVGAEGRKAPPPVAPPRMFVRSATDVAEEKRKAEEDRRLNNTSLGILARVTAPSAPTAAPRPPVPVPAPASRPAPVSPPPMAPPPVRKAPPAPPPITLTPVTLTPVNLRPGGPAPAPLAPPPSVPAPVVVPSLAPRPAPVPAAPSAPTAPDTVAPAQPEAAPSAPVGELKVISVKPPIVVKDFATLIGMKHFRLVSELMGMGIFASVNQAIDEAVAQKIAEKHGFLLEVKHRGEAAPQQVKPKKVEPEQDESKLLRPRPPVVCIMGHVDHGKTSLLDAIRKANVAAGEAGGITQHIGAYQVEHKGQKITFLDTPGHAAFTKMRARGAGVGDIVVLVVAADDGFMPQTDEALRIARQSNVAIIACINKKDVKGANIDRVKQQLQERNLTPEDWGGETLVVPTSAVKGDGIPELLDSILLQAEILELKANPVAESQGVIIEAETEVGIGHTATVIVQRGTLKVGSAVVCGAQFAKVRTLLDDRGKPLREAGPSTPLRLPGWSGIPECGSTFTVVKNDRIAREMAEEFALEEKKRRAAELQTAESAPVTAAELLAKISETQKKTLRVLIKADVVGSLEAITAMLQGIKSDKVQLEIVHTDVGVITKNDILRASSAGAEIIGFQVRREPGVEAIAKHHAVRITDYEIIYELYDGVRGQMADLLEPETRETKVGLAQVRAVFPISKGFVAGCLVTEGRVVKDFSCRVLRKKVLVFSGKLETLRRVKDEVSEVRAGTECGLHVVGYEGYQPGDEIECFEVHKIRASL